MQTRYFVRIGVDKYQEANLKDDNWWYMQVDASIRYAFMKYDLAVPEFVYFDKYETIVDGIKVQHVIIRIVRYPIKSVKQAQKWVEKRYRVIDELTRQAHTNSDEDIEYKFEII